MTTLARARAATRPCALAPLVAIAVASTFLLPASSSAQAAPSILHVQDQASILSAQQAAALESRLAAFAQHTQLVVATRILPDPSAIESLGDPAYKDLVRRVGNSRVVLLMVGYAPDKSHGVLWTAEGPDVWAGLNKAEVEKMMADAENPLTSERLVALVQALATKLEEAHTQYPGPEVRNTFLRTVIDRLPAAAGLLLGLTAVALIWRGGGLCPHCGGPLKTRVSISLVSGPRGRIAKKTYKCFRCGYSRRRSLWPAAAAPGGRTRGGRERHRAVS